MRFKNVQWYLAHPLDNFDLIPRHHNSKWTDLQIRILIDCFESKIPFEEMSKMLGRTEYGLLYQLERQRLIWFDNDSKRYFKRNPKREYNYYDGKKHL